MRLSNRYFSLLAVLASTSAAAASSELSYTNNSVLGVDDYFKGGTVVSVYERPRKDFDPLGIRAGSYILNPAIEVGYVYDDNIYAQESNEEDDNIFTVAPELRMKSDWSNHMAYFNVRGKSGFYADNNSEDFHDALVGLGGRLDIVRDTYVTLDTEYKRAHENRGTPDLPASLSAPVVYDQSLADLRFVRKAARLSLDLGAEVRDLNFDDERTTSGTLIDMDLRDRNHYDFLARVGYEVHPGYQIFLDSGYNFRRYDESASEVKDSEGYEVSLGAAADITGKTAAEFMIGYLNQDYDGAQYPTIEGLNFAGLLVWNPTYLTSLILQVEREVKETFLTDASGYIATAFTAGVEHELLRNLLLGASAGYQNHDYEMVTGATQREDDLYMGTLNARYFIYRGVSLDGTYRYTNRDSNITNSDFDDNTVALTLRASL